MASSSEKPPIWIYSENQETVIDNDYGSYPPNHFEIMRQHFTPIGWKDIEENPSNLRDKVLGAIVSVAHSTKFNKQLDLMPNLKAVSVYGKGTDHVDLKRMSSLGIKVLKETGNSDASVADCGIALMMCSARNLVKGKFHWIDLYSNVN